MEFTVFDFVKQILQGNSNGNKVTLTEENKEIYNIYVINKALSFHRDTLFLANIANSYRNLPENWHFEFLLNSVRKYKRPFAPWIKFENSKKINLIRTFFNISKQEAVDIEDLICDEDIREIEKQLEQGGINNDKSKSAGTG